MTVGDGVIIFARWAHILAAATLVGGGIFYLLGPRFAREGGLAASAVEGFQNALAERARLVDLCILVLVVSGAIVAFARLTQPETRGLYFSLLGAKLLLAIIALSLVRRLGQGERALSEEPSHLRLRASRVFRRLFSLGRWRPLSTAELAVALGAVAFLLSIILRAIFENSLTKG